MEYKNTWADNRMIRKMENEERNMLSKFYNLKKSDANCPKNPYLLKPENLHLTSYEVLPDNSIQLNVGYFKTWSGYVSSGMRMNYDQYIFGTIYCEQVEEIKEVELNRKGTITIPFFSKSKILNLPVQKGQNVFIRCKKIRVQEIATYVKDSDEGYILEEVFLQNLRNQLEKKYNSNNNE